jgi:polyphosphate glucokinase
MDSDEQRAPQSGSATDRTAIPSNPQPSLGLGIDFGGTGIKAALLDLATGELVSSRIRVSTPRPSTPDAVAATIVTVVARVAKEHAIPDGIPVGIGLPGVVKDGVTMTAANIDKAWVGTSANAVVGAALGRRVYAMNDADAAGLAEVRLGAGRDQRGTVLMLTIGTGIGSGLFVDGELVPNMELGHLEVNGRDAETRVSALARERRRLRWKTWATEFNEYLARIEAYLWPDLIIIGGGISKVMDKYGPLLKSRAPIAQAQYRNTSGIIGAALNAADRTRIDTLRGFATTVAAAATPAAGDGDGLPVVADGVPVVAEPLTTLQAPATDTDRTVVAEVKPAG